MWTTVNQSGLKEGVHEKTVLGLGKFSKPLEQFLFFIQLFQRMQTKNYYNLAIPLKAEGLISCWWKRNRK